MESVEPTASLERQGIMRLEGKVAFITGGGKGMGREAGILFAKEGAKVVLMDLDDLAGRETAMEINGHDGEAHFIKGDAADEAVLQAALDEAAEKYGALHILYANAGVLWKQVDSSVLDTSGETWDKVMTINTKGPFLLAKHGIPHLIRAKGGSIILVGGVAACAGSVLASDAFVASKAALAGMCKSIAVQFGPEQVRCNIIHPGLVDTPMQEHYLDERSRHEIASSLPLRRIGRARDIAHAALFLASDESSWMTGAELVIDGGFLAG